MSFCPNRDSHSHGMPSIEEKKQIVDGAQQGHALRTHVAAGSWALHRPWNSAVNNRHKQHSAD